MIEIMFKLFARKMEQWFLYDTSAPLVRIMDFLFGSSCAYCFAIRCGMFGFGIREFDFFGAAIVATAILLAYLERKYLD